ncbi:hypothetical protein EDEG_03041 [Edhazardia aedis USNM 41457]|uniref:DNA-directed RNA polymerase III subunit RPC3 n=1 Tax=Edhazardia aedis (strain USNM 41457) TaxID=1003232 RepID=J9D444_EDHAE|nr:hypothetical protein EDEG_03041 [Edhazardia aedis USNM 41457]|eukprot:EJW02551.1 hypothetical protein EDEG_03041 [Edhazardia aedis USNM 41457]
MNNTLQVILSDYGDLVNTVLQRIKTNTTLKELFKTPVKRGEFFKALFILLQKRFVAYSKLENTYVYNINYRNIYRRLYFALYVEFVDKNHFKMFTDVFLKVLCTGVCSVKQFRDIKTVSRMIDLKLLKYSDNNVDFNFSSMERSTEFFDEKENVKKLKTVEKNQFVMVDYENLEEAMILKYFKDSIIEKYTTKIEDILTRLLAQPLINEQTIKKIIDEIKGNEASNEKLLESYVFYLKNDHILVPDPTMKNFRFDKKSMEIMLKKACMLNYTMENMSKHCKRVLNCIFERKMVEDKDISKYALLDAKTMRSVCLDLHQELFIQLCVMQKENKNFHIWEIDHLKAFKLCALKFQDKIIEKIPLIDNFWKVSLYTGSDISSDQVYISDLLQLAKSHFILTYE